jgi:high affinity Mn2+ porin
MTIKMSIYLVCFFVIGGAASLSYGEDMPTNMELLNQIKELRETVRAQSERITTLEGVIKIQEQAVREHDDLIKQERVQQVSSRMAGEMEGLKDLGGLEIGAGMTFVGQGTPNANNGDATDGEDSRFDGSWSADVEIAKAFDDYGSTSLTTGGMAFLHMEVGQGDSVEGELSVFSNVNRDAGDSAANVQITEAWYEQYLFEEQLTITAGKIDATGYIDTNEFANDECSQFLGHIFRNSAVIDWPDDNNWGGRVYLAPEALSFIDIEAVFMEEDGEWENLFDNPFIAAQLNFMPAKVFDYDEEMWGGNYRAIFWYNGAPHAKVKDAGDFERGNAGFGFSCDQKLTDVYGVFGRFGWANSEKSDLCIDWSFGGQMTGEYWMREDDIVGIAVGQAIPGKEYRDTNADHHAETHLEAYYAFKVNEHLTLSPDMQWIWNPNGVSDSADGDNDCIFVYGVRGQVDF